MNHPSEWNKIYHPKLGRYVYKHKGIGVIRDTLFKIGKPLFKFVKSETAKFGKKTTEKLEKKVQSTLLKKQDTKLEVFCEKSLL